MVAVPSGRVTLSDRRTRRTWEVEVAPYELAAFPVTRSTYEQVTCLRPGPAQGHRLPGVGQAPQPPDISD